MKELERLLLPLKKAVIRKNLINLCICGLFVALCVDVILVIIAKFTLVLNLAIYLLSIPLVFCAVMALIALCIRPKTKKLCQIADSLGLKERCITAYDLLSKCKNDEMAILEISDAIDNLRKMDFNKQYRPKLFLWLMKASGIVALVMFIAVFIPSPRQEKIDDMARVHQKAMEEYEKVEKTADEIIADKQTKKQIDRQLKSLKRQLKSAKTTQQAVDAVRESQQQLKKIEKENSSISELSQALKQNELTRTLGEALQKNNLEQTKQQLQAMNNAINNMSQAELSALGKELSAISQQLSQNNEAKQLLEQMGQVMQNNADLQEINQLMEQLNNTISQQAQNNAELQQAIEDMNKAMENSANRMEGKPQQNNNQQQSGNGGQQQGGGQQDGDGGQQQGGDQQGGDGGQQQGGGQQSGDGGQQQGGGQQSGDSGQQGGDGNVGGGQGRGQGHIANENIYTEIDQNRQKEDVQLQGSENGDGQFTKSQKLGDGAVGEIVPYGDVVTQYKEEALEDIGNNSLPYGMEEIVKDYFSNLE